MLRVAALALVMGLAAGCGGNSARPAPASDVFSINPDGSGLRDLTDTPGLRERFVSVAPDGRTLAFLRRGEVIVRTRAARERSVGHFKYHLYGDLLWGP